jgi:hypothetical protein
VTLRLRVLTTFGILLCLAAVQPAPASAQHVSIGVGVGVGVPGYPVVVGGGFHYPYYRGYRYGYPWYPYGGYPYYAYASPYPYPYAYGYAYPYPYYDSTSGLRLQVTPRETEVYIDGYFAGVVDNFDGTFQRLDLAPGEHNLELFLPGHRAVQKGMYLQPGKTTRLKLAMQPLAAGEQEPLRPSGQPLPQSQAPQQKGSTTQGNVPPGGQARRPQGAGPAQPAPANGDTIDLTPSAPVRNTDSGGLALRVQPGAANILVDGEQWEGPEGSERLVLQLAPGKHVVEIQKDGYRRYTTEVTVKPGETTALNVGLTKQ